MDENAGEVGQISHNVPELNEAYSFCLAHVERRAGYYNKAAGEHGCRRRGKQRRTIMEELKHTKGPWIIKGDQVISTSVKNIDWSAFGNRAPIGASDITLICTLPMQMNYKDAPYNGLLISLAPEMLESLIKAHNELISISRLQDWHSESFRTVIEEMERTIEAATNMKIEEVLEATARQEAER